MAVPSGNLPEVSVPAGVWWIAGCAGILLCGIMGCSGAGYFWISDLLRKQGDRHAAKVAVEKARQDRLDEGMGGLESLAAHVESMRVRRREYPFELEELPPVDVWGEDVEYGRIGPDRAFVRSNGPDREPDTADDLRIDLPR